MVNQHNKFRLNKDAIRQTLAYHTDYHYKPVWDGTEGGYPLVFDMCAEKGYNMTGRDHIIAFNTKRGV
jgi:7-carboxy-7-deazaguanine synthase